MLWDMSLKHEVLGGISLRKSTENSYYKFGRSLFGLKYLSIANFTRTYGPREPLTRTVEGVCACEGP